MADIYVQRELVVSRDGTERSVAEADILSLDLPLVVLGDPGIGKTKLTESLATRLGARRVSAGSFVRNANPETLTPSAGLPIIIDGLDELTSSSGSSAVDEVLKKLSAMSYPPFICLVALQTGADRRAGRRF